MTLYKFQYWLYAILNKQFGTEVKFHRDSLHKIYEVNRHGFEIATNTLDINIVKRWFIDKLLKSGFKNSSKEPNYYIKDIDGKSYCVTLHQQNHGLDYRFSNRPVIIVGLYSHKIYKKN